MKLRHIWALFVAERCSDFPESPGGKGWSGAVGTRTDWAVNQPKRGSTPHHSTPFYFNPQRRLLPELRRLQVKVQFETEALAMSVEGI